VKVECPVCSLINTVGVDVSAFRCEYCSAIIKVKRNIHGDITLVSLASGEEHLLSSLKTHIEVASKLVARSTLVPKAWSVSLDHMAQRIDEILASIE